MNPVPINTGVLAYPDGCRNIMFAFPCSVVELPDERLVCTYHGRPEQHELGGCYASYSEDDGQTWSEPELLIGRDGKNVHADPNIVVHGDRVMIFSMSYRYQVDPSAKKGDWTPDLTRSLISRLVSADSGRTWSQPTGMAQPHAFLTGMNHRGLALPDGTLVMGYAWGQSAEQGLDTRTEDGMNTCAGVLRSSDGGDTWMPGADIRVHAAHPTGADEPAIVLLDDGTLYTLVRTGTDRLWESRSRDGGLTWDPPRPSPLLGHRCPAELIRLDREPETVMVVHNNHPTHRINLSMALSTDGCRTWSPPTVIDPAPDGGHAAYPAACCTSRGTVVLAWYQADDPEGTYHIRWARFGN